MSLSSMSPSFHPILLKPLPKGHYDWVERWKTHASYEPEDVPGAYLRAKIEPGEALRQAFESSKPSSVEAFLESVEGQHIKEWMKVYGLTPDGEGHVWSNMFTTVWNDLGLKKAKVNKMSNAALKDRLEEGRHLGVMWSMILGLYGHDINASWMQKAVWEAPSQSGMLSWRSWEHLLGVTTPHEFNSLSQACVKEMMQATLHHSRAQKDTWRAAMWVGAWWRSVLSSSNLFTFKDNFLNVAMDRANYLKEGLALMSEGDTSKAREKWAKSASDDTLGRWVSWINKQGLPLVWTEPVTMLSSSFLPNGKKQYVEPNWEDELATVTPLDIVLSQQAWTAPAKPGVVLWLLLSPTGLRLHPEVVGRGLEECLECLVLSHNRLFSKTFGADRYFPRWFEAMDALLAYHQYQGQEIRLSEKGLENWMDFESKLASLNLGDWKKDQEIFVERQDHQRLVVQWLRDKKLVLPEGGVERLGQHLGELGSELLLERSWGAQESNQEGAHVRRKRF